MKATSGTTETTEEDGAKGADEAQKGPTQPEGGEKGDPQGNSESTPQGPNSGQEQGQNGDEEQGGADGVEQPNRSLEHVRLVAGPHVQISCPARSLSPGSEMVCQATSEALAYYSSTAWVIGTPAGGGAPVMAVVAPDPLAAAE